LRPPHARHMILAHGDAPNRFALYRRRGSQPTEHKRQLPLRRGVERAGRVGEQIGRRLKENLGGSPHVADIRGLGMMWGIEFVKDRQSLVPFPRS